jgi:hypothetical protein
MIKLMRGKAPGRWLETSDADGRWTWTRVFRVAREGPTVPSCVDLADRSGASKSRRPTCGRPAAHETKDLASARNQR